MKGAINCTQIEFRKEKHPPIVLIRKLYMYQDMYAYIISWIVRVLISHPFVHVYRNKLCSIFICTQTLSLNVHIIEELYMYITFRWNIYFVLKTTSKYAKVHYLKCIYA